MENHNQRFIDHCETKLTHFQVSKVPKLSITALLVFATSQTFFMIFPCPFQLYAVGNRR